MTPRLASLGLRVSGLALLTFGGLAACGGSDIPDNLPDAAVPDALQDPCRAPATVASVDTSEGVARFLSDRRRLFQASMDSNALYDVLSIELYAGYGVFGPANTGNIKTGTFDLTNAEASYDTCGACVLVYADVDPANRRGKAIYLAQSGSLTLDEIDGKLKGTLTNAVLRKVNIDFSDPDGAGPMQPSYATSNVGDGCQIAITTASFDAVYGAPGADGGVPRAPEPEVGILKPER